MDVPDELLRPVLEVALAIAVVGARQRPPIVPPTSLKPFLRFQKLPTTALAAVRRTVEEDDAFRKLVAAVATEEVVDRPSWLWLHRPDGWEEELATLVDGNGTGERGRGRAKGVDRVAAGRLEAVESRSRRLSAELEVLRREVVRAQDARAKAESEAARGKERADELERALSRARSRAERTGAEAAEARDNVAAATAEIEVLRRALEEAEARLTAPEHIGLPEVARSSGDGLVAVPSAALGALEHAAAAAAGLASALDELASSLSVGRGDTGAMAVRRPDAASTPVEVLPAPREPARRRPLRLPRGMHAATIEADGWLLTEAGAPVVVDGYNVAMLGWPGQPLVDQRVRLLDLLDDLSCRYKTSVQVVFDGADVGAVRTERRHRIAVRFSPPSVLADDVIRQIVADHATEQPIVVVTNDRAVARDVRVAGANVVSSDGLLAVGRR